MKVFCENHVFLHAWRVDATVVALICLDLWRNGKMEVFGNFTCLEGRRDGCCLDLPPLVGEWENGGFWQKPCVFTCIFDEVENPPTPPEESP